jgi:fumarate reductase flavoprotein subunit
MSEKQADVLVMGSGLAGVSAALTAVRNGAKVILAEKRPFQGGGVSNTPMMTMAVKDDPEYQDAAFKTHMDYTNWNADTSVVKTWLRNSTRIPEFITGLGLDFLMVVPTALENIGKERGYCGGFPNGYNLGDYYFFKPIGKGHGAAVIVKRAVDEFKKLGGEVLFNTKVKNFLLKDGVAIGAIAEDVKTKEEMKINVKAVIIASGGFSDNPEMIERYTGHKYTNINCDGGGDVLFNTFYNAQMDGDGQQAAWTVGGARGAMGINGHNLVPGPGVIKHTPWIPFNEFRVVQEQPYLWVNVLGKRFISEDMSNDHMAMGTAIGNQPKKQSFIIFDEDTKLHMENEGLDYIYHIFPAEQLHGVTAQFEEAINVTGNKHTFLADSIEELADQAGIDKEGLLETVKKYNEYADKKHDDDYGKNPAFIRPIRRGKFYALRVYKGGYQAMGGIKIDGQCRVLKEDGRAIPGLYAAGDCSAGEVFGNPPIGGIGISTISFSQGFAAADEAVTYIGEVK